MDRRTLDTWLPLSIAVALPILTAFGNAWLLLGGTLAGMVIMAVLYSRCEKSLFAVMLAMLASAVIAAAMLGVWVKARH